MLGLFIRLGFDHDILLNTYRHLAQKYDFSNKLGDLSELECLFKEKGNSDTPNISN